MTGRKRLSVEDIVHILRRANEVGCGRQGRRP